MGNIVKWIGIFFAVMFVLGLVMKLVDYDPKDRGGKSSSSRVDKDLDIWKDSAKYGRSGCFEGEADQCKRMETALKKLCFNHKRADDCTELGSWYTVAGLPGLASRPRLLGCEYGNKRACTLLE